MNIVKKSNKTPKISLILLDWNCRESFHIFDYLKQQTMKDFEIIWIEYYNNKPKELEKKNIDTWIILEMPKEFYYHKHLMYNIGIYYSEGEIIVIMDSDVMVKETFTKTIIEEFEKNDNIVLHLDEFRNINPKYYPFNYPSFEEFLNNGCKNCANGVTIGIKNRYDPIHNLNYGACFCAKKEDLIAIGGADEHIDYLGHICGPYEMTFRLENFGKIVKWSKKEFLYHTWHPGSDGIGNYCAPHDGKNVSLRALELLDNKKISPYVENKAIKLLKENKFNEKLLFENVSKNWSIYKLG